MTTVLAVVTFCLLCLCSILCKNSHYSTKRDGSFTFYPIVKPLPILFLILRLCYTCVHLLPVLSNSAESIFYCTTLGLLCGAIGDVCLTQRGTGVNVLGIIAFLAGHLLYMKGFVTPSWHLESWQNGIGGMIGAMTVWVLYLIWGVSRRIIGAKNKAYSIAAYVNAHPFVSFAIFALSMSYIFCLFLMAIWAWNFCIYHNLLHYTLTYGAILFVISDLLIGMVLVEKSSATTASRPHPGAEAVIDGYRLHKACASLILPCYYSAQAVLAAGVEDFILRASS